MRRAKSVPCLQALEASPLLSFVMTMLVIIAMMLPSVADSAVPSLTLSWEDNTPIDHDGFYVERKTGVGGTYAQIDTVASPIPGYIDNGVTQGVTYCYRVRAYSAGMTSDYSNEACASPQLLTVIINGNGNGSVTITPPGTTITSGGTYSGFHASTANVAVTALAATGSYFAQWSDACTGTGACNVTMNADQSVTATFTLLPPTVSGVVPSTGPTAGGTAVTITGAYFVTGATASFGGTSATGITVVSSTSITATTQAHATGTVNVVVTNPDSQSGTLDNGFTYGSGPGLASVSPSVGPVLVAQAVTLTGVNFAQPGAGTTTVTVGGTAATGVSVVNDTTITATFPAKAAGAYDVVVTNNHGSSTLTNGFTYGAAPTLSSLTPDTGTAGSVRAGVTLTGSGFAQAGAGTTTVTVGGTAATGVTVVNDTTVTADFPAKAAGTYNVTLTNTFGSSTLSNGFAYLSTVTLGASSPESVLFSASTGFGQSSLDALRAEGFDINQEDASRVTMTGQGIRIVAGRGDLRGATNDAKNLLLKNLPSDWRSMVLKIRSASLERPRQGAHLLAFQDVDNWVMVNIHYEGAPLNGTVLEFAFESGGVTTVQSLTTTTLTTNFCLRLDRASDGSTYTGFASGDCQTWTQLSGTIVLALTNARAGIFVGADLLDPEGNSELESLTIYAASPFSTTTSQPSAMSEGGDNGLCFIATAAYGSPLHPHLNILREFREVYLRPTVLGRAFIRHYEQISPPIARTIAEQPVLQATVRIILWPVVGAAYTLLHGGATLLVIGLAGFVGICWITRKRRTVD